MKIKMFFTNLIMYFRYIEKIHFLERLKRKKGLDFVGRFEENDKKLRGYEGCYPIKKLLKRLNISISDTIIDIGCGKGLFLYYASKFDFNEIYGIDYSEELINIAQRNIEKLGDKRINISLCDARTFSDYDKFNYFFINNPFDLDIMNELAKNIKLSYESVKRRIIIIYQFYFSKTAFLEHGFSILYEKFPNIVLTLDG